MTKRREVDENLEMVLRIREGECPGVGPREKVDSEELIHELMLELEKRKYIEGGGPYREGVERGKVAYFGRRMLQNCGIRGNFV